MRLQDLEDMHFYIVYRGAEPLEAGDRRGYFNEILSLLGGCDKPLSARVVADLVAATQRKFNRSVSRAAKD
jgi:hypothetical protein